MQNAHYFCKILVKSKLYEQIFMKIPTYSPMKIRHMEAELTEADRQPKRPTLLPYFNQSRIFPTCFHESPQFQVPRKFVLWKPN